MTDEIESAYDLRVKFEELVEEHAHYYEYSSMKNKYEQEQIKLFIEYLQNLIVEFQDHLIKDS